MKGTHEGIYTLGLGACIVCLATDHYSLIFTWLIAQEVFITL